MGQFELFILIGAVRTVDRTLMLSTMQRRMRVRVFKGQSVYAAETLTVMLVCQTLWSVKTSDTKPQLAEDRLLDRPASTVIHRKQS